MLDRDGWFANCENECGAASCDQLKPDDFKDADTCLRSEFQKVGFILCGDKVSFCEANLSFEGACDLLPHPIENNVRRFYHRI